MSALFDHVTRTRRELADYLATLDEPGWKAPTLCSGWTVREVAGHVVSPLVLSQAQVFAAYARTGFRFHVLMDRAAREQAQRPTAEIVALLREPTRGFVPPVAGERAILLDVTIHSLDVRWPAKAEARVDPSVLLTSLNFMVSGNPVLKLANTYKHAGVRFEADDIAWTHGEGALVHGPADALLMAMFGRPAGLDRLGGDGVSVLRKRS